MHLEMRMKRSVQIEAKEEVQNETKQDEQIKQKILHTVHGRFINETDFPKGGSEAYRKWMDEYIKTMYEPLDENYDETRYFTQDWEQSFGRKCLYKTPNNRFITAIRLKKSAPVDPK